MYFYGESVKNAPWTSEWTNIKWKYSGPLTLSSLFSIYEISSSKYPGQSFTPTCPWLVSYKTNNFQLNDCIENVFWISINNMDPNNGSHRGWLSERVDMFTFSPFLKHFSFNFWPLLSPPPLILGVSFTTNICCVTWYSNIHDDELSAQGSPLNIIWWC